MIYLNKEFNSLIFTEKDFDLNYNYIPDLFLAVRELNPKKEIYIAINLPETPIIFVMFFRKIIQESPAKIYVYFRDDSKALKDGLELSGIQYRNIKNYPWELPMEDLFPDD